MILTGKAKEEFETWLDNYSQKHHQEEWLDNDLYLDEVYLPNELMNALIIEWLDSVGLHIYLRRDDVAQQGFNWSIESKKYGFHNLYNHAFYFDRNQATDKAIEMAVEIYNNM